MLNNSGYNPDVLSCIANLSSDEVFSPPALVNQMIDLLPDSLWSDPNTRVLDPGCKSGVFLREIAKRLDKGLEEQIPDRQTRINHIFSSQLFGLAITELTALLARRSLYCSKWANGKYSVCDDFDDDAGNISFSRIEHTWADGRCIHCGANQLNYDAGDDLESHAYNFIHTDKPEDIFNMKFDVIIGNPPYQLNDGGGTGSSAKPIYHLFVEQAIKLNPQFLVMIIPSRWFTGGKGLDEFRNKILRDNRIHTIVDYFDSTQCFPGVDISGGVCYFMWKKDHSGDCDVISIRGESLSTMHRPLLEEGSDTFIRFNEAVSIIRKIKSKNQRSFEKLVSARKPFGISSIVSINEKQLSDLVFIHAYPKNGYIKNREISHNIEWVDKFKVYIAKAYGERGAFPYLVLGKPFIGLPGTCCSETYLVLGPFKSHKESKNVISYVKTKFFRFLVLMKKNTQNAPKGVYTFVPAQEFEHRWTDNELYRMYGLTPDETSFIESMIRPMELDNG